MQPNVLIHKQQFPILDLLMKGVTMEPSSSHIAASSRLNKLEALNRADTGWTRHYHHMQGITQNLKKQVIHRRALKFEN